MVGVLSFSYCLGERSSRRIERRQFRVVAANQQPDQRHRQRLDHDSETPGQDYSGVCPHPYMGTCVLSAFP